MSSDKVILSLLLKLLNLMCERGDGDQLAILVLKFGVISLSLSMVDMEKMQLIMNSTPSPR